MAASSSSSSHRERPIEERFERAVAVIRSLPQDGTYEQLFLDGEGVNHSITFPSLPTGPYQPSNMVKLKVNGVGGRG